MKSKKSVFRSIFALILSLAILSGMTVAVYAEAEPQTVYSGTCGENVSWTLYDNGKLVISGTGEMYNYSFIINELSPFYYKKSLFKEVVIEEGVTNIGEYAFYECSNLSGISIADSVTSIGKDAFYYCSSLTSINIPDSVTSIGKYAFIYCNGLESIKVDEKNTVYDSRENCNAIIKTETNEFILGCKKTKIPDNVTSIGVGAFWGCSGLTSIIIPESVTGIGQSAFIGCSGLTSIKIPDGLTVIENNVFDGCKGLVTITIPDSVTRIGNYAFRSCISLTSISLSDSVTSIGSYAFEECINLKNISLPDSLKSIGQYAFNNCNKLTSIDIPDGVTSIGDHAFYYCSGLTSISIPDSVTSIGSSAFGGCSGLTSISIPDRVTSIGYAVFGGCSGLTSINIPIGVTNIGRYAFGRCSGLTSIIIPDSVTSVGDSAFSGCSGLTNISIPDSVTSIENNAFIYCSGLESIKVDEKNTVYDSRENCNAIIKTETNELISGCNATVIPDSVTRIGGSAFEGHSGLTSINIPDSVTSIGTSAFKGCSGLTSINIPDRVTSIGNSAFYGCSGLKSINIPNSVTSIGVSAFSDCSRLTSVNIPDGVTRIENNTFYKCSNITNIKLPDSVQSIGERAFAYCYNLLVVIIPEGITSIGKDAFYCCSKLVKGSDNVIKCGIIALCNGITDSLPSYYSVIVDGIPVEEMTEAVITNDIIKIANNAFAKCTSLKEVTIGNNVKSIGSNAFANCPLETVYFKGTKAEWDEVCGKNVNLSSADVIFVDYSCGEELSAKFSLNSSTLTIYGSGRMEDCSSAEDLPWYGIKDSIKTVVFDGEPTSIGDYAFSGLSALESIEIPESVTSIGAGAFENCTSLKEITVPSAVDKINENAFKNCTALKTVNLPDGITNIGEKAFYNTAVYNDPASYKGNNVLYLDDNRYLIAYGSQLDGQSFNGIVNPNAVLVADGAFRGADCETVQLSEGLKYIGKEAFADSSVKTVYFPEGVETCSKDIFKGCGSLTVNYSSSISDWYRRQISLPENSVVYFTAKTEDGKVSVIYCNDDLPQEIGDISIDKNSPELEVKTKAFDGSETQKQFETISEHGFTMDYYDDIEVMDIKLKNAKGEVQPKAGKSVRVKIKAPDSVREKILEFLDFRGDFNELKINSDGVFLNGNINYFSPKQQKEVIQKILLWHFFNNGEYMGKHFETITFDRNLELENGYLIFYVKHFSEFSVFTSPFEFVEKEINFDIGTKKKLDYILLDDQKTIRFESSKPSVATVDSSGVVTAQKSGETVITAYCDGVEVGSCTVKVNSPTLIFSENLTGTKVDYMTTVNFFCQVENLPEGATVRWYIDGSEYALGETCTVKGVKKNFKISVKIVAEDGTVLTEKNEQLIEVKNGFFDKLLGFFRKLFGTLKTVNIS